jgi:hypothetical protein
LLTKQALSRKKWLCHDVVTRTSKLEKGTTTRTCEPECGRTRVTPESFYHLNKMTGAIAIQGRL